MCFYLDIFVCHQNAIAKERNYARRWIIIGAKIVDGTKDRKWHRVARWWHSETIPVIIIPVDQQWIYTGRLFWKWRRSSISKMAKPSEMPNQYTRYTCFNVIFEHRFIAARRRRLFIWFAVILVQPYSYDNERCEILDVHYYWPMRCATRPCAASLNLRASKSLRRNWKPCPDRVVVL